MIKELFKERRAQLGIWGAVFVAVFVVFEMLGGLSPADVKVLDARITFKFTAFENKDQYFVSYSLENKKNKRVKVRAQVQIGNLNFGGKIFHAIQSKNDSVILAPMEIKSFVVQMDLPKAKGAEAREFDVFAKIKKVSRA